MNRSERINTIKEINKCNSSNAIVSAQASLRVLLGCIANAAIFVQEEGFNMLFRALKTKQKTIVDYNLS